MRNCCAEMEFPKKKILHFEKEFGVFLNIFEFIGLQNFSVNQLNLLESPSACRFLYMIIRMCIMCLLMVFYIIGVSEKSGNHSNVLMTFIQGTMNLGMILAICISFLQSYFSSSKIKKYFLNFKEILNIMHNELLIDLDFVKIRRRIYVRLFVLWLTFTGFYFMSGEYNSGHEDLTILFLSYIPIMFVVLIIFHYIFFVDLINQLLELITNFMLQMNVPRFINTQTIDGKPIKTVKTVDDFNENFRKIETCRYVYNKVYENGSLVNGSFGMTILLIFLNIVIALTVSGYKIFILVVGNKEFYLFTGKNNTKIIYFFAN